MTASSVMGLINNTNRIRGEIRMDEIRVMPFDAAPGIGFKFPCLHSTRLYPEWPFAKLPDTSEELSREVAVTLR